MASDLEVCHTDSSLALDCHLASDQSAHDEDQLQLLQYSLSGSGGTKLEKLNGVAAAAAAAQDPCPELEELSWTGVGFIVRLFGL
jgi:hypothetical protein